MDVFCQTIHFGREEPPIAGGVIVWKAILIARMLQSQIIL